MGPILRIGKNQKAPTIRRPPNRSNNGATFIALQERDDLCGVRVVPIGTLFEKKIRLAASLAVGKVAPPNVRYWANSGRHLLTLSSSQFDPLRTRPKTRPERSVCPLLSATTIKT
jgi:hypothetical protein